VFGLIASLATTSLTFGNWSPSWHVKEIGLLAC
jgi:hypothetical protein